MLEQRLITSHDHIHLRCCRTLQDSIVSFITEHFELSFGGNHFGEFVEVDGDARQLFGIVTEFCCQDTQELMNNRFGYEKLIPAFYYSQDCLFCPPPWDSKSGDEYIGIKNYPQLSSSRSKSLSERIPFSLAF